MNDYILQYLLNGITYGSIYALAALGFTIIYRTTDIINFAQGEFIMLGGMFMYTFSETLQIHLFLSVILSIICCSVLGIIMERVFIRPAINSGTVKLIIITIGLSIVIHTAAMLIWGKNSLIIKHFSETETLRISDNLIVNTQNIWIISVTLLFMIILHLLFEKTMAGKAFTACSSNPVAASLVGINRSKMIMFSFMLASGIGGLGGTLLTPLTTAQYDMGVLFGLKGFCAAIIGGLGNNVGAIAGGLLLGIIQELGAGFISSGYKDAISFLILIIFLIFKPSGILGSKWKKRV